MISLPNNSSRKGFTLVELMIAISVIAILSTIGLSVYTSSQKLARDAKRKADLGQIKNSLLMYYNDFKAYPSATTWINSGGGAGWFSALTTNYIDRVPTDPINKCPSGSLIATATCNQYGYFTLSAASPCPAANQHFILATNLENKDDPLANSKQAYTLCNGTTFTSPNLYVIANNN